MLHVAVLCCFLLQVLSFAAAKALMKDEEFLEPVYNYWVKKHKNNNCVNRLILQLKSEKKDAQSPNDPYVAFRRRIEKMQTRKVQYNTIQYNTIQYNTLYNTIQYIIQYIIQYNTLYNTIQYNTILLAHRVSRITIIFIIFKPFIFLLSMWYLNLEIL